MFHKPQLDKKETTIDSLIGKKIHIHGDVIFEGGLRLDGQITGHLKIKDQQTGTLIISEQARVVGEVHVTHLVMNGYVEGDVHVSSLLELQPQARIKGDVHYVMLEMHQGAIVEGRLIHTPSLEQPMQTQQQHMQHMQSQRNSTNHGNHNAELAASNEENKAPVGFHFNPAATNSAGLVNHSSQSNQSMPQSLFTEVKNETYEYPHSSADKQVDNQDSAKDQTPANPLEQLQNKIAEGLSFFKGK